MDVSALLGVENSQALDSPQYFQKKHIFITYEDGLSMDQEEERNQEENGNPAPMHQKPCPTMRMAFPWTRRR